VPPQSHSSPTATAELCAGSQRTVRRQRENCATAVGELCVLHKQKRGCVVIQDLFKNNGFNSTFGNCFTASRASEKQKKKNKRKQEKKYFLMLVFFCFFLFFLVFLKPPQA
jgi:hypothetical protein